MSHALYLIKKLFNARMTALERRPVSFVCDGDFTIDETLLPAAQRAAQLYKYGLALETAPDSQHWHRQISHGERLYLLGRLKPSFKPKTYRAPINYQASEVTYAITLPNSR